MYTLNDPLFVHSSCYLGLVFQNPPKLESKVIMLPFPYVFFFSEYSQNFYSQNFLRIFTNILGKKNQFLKEINKNSV